MSDVLTVTRLQIEWNTEAQNYLNTFNIKRLLIYKRKEQFTDFEMPRFKPSLVFAFILLFHGKTLSNDKLIKTVAKAIVII